MAATVLVIFGVYLMRPAAVQEPEIAIPPAVRIHTVKPEVFQFRVDAQGTVAPRREGELRPQVSGEVIWVSPSLVPGGFFEAGEVLLRVDPLDYESDLEMARAVLARAESEASRARKELKRQRMLADRSVASQARIDDSENAARVAGAALREAQSLLERAERDLTRTEIEAPYAGRVRSERVGPGQFVTRGESLAEIYAVDFAEVRLPIPDRELGFISLPLGYRNTVQPEPAHAGGSDLASRAFGSMAPRVRLRAEFAGSEHEWWGELVRTEGEIDAKTRMVTVVARIEDPYGRSGDGQRPPLAVGLFVQAMIEGIELADAIVLPRSSVQQDGRVALVDDEGRVHFRAIDVMRSERDRVIVRSGLQTGDRVSLTPMPWALEGMQVVPVNDARVAVEVGS